MFQKSLLILAITAACAGAQAQSATPQAPASNASSPAKKELVARILKIQQPAIDNMAQSLVQEPLGPLLERADAALQQRVPPEKRDAVAKGIQEDTRKFVQDTVPIVRDRATKLAPTVIGPMLEEKFTEDELKQVVAMLESPVLAKFQAAGVDIQRALAEKVIAETRPQVEQRFRSLEDSMAKRLGVPPPNASGGAPAPSTGKPAKK
ncbi:hypothetical protein JJB11_23845 [Ramlibacter ginsenosidimutans]|uniref:DUF2059 domain-containing protein n=1 Tax=Ramlibacter ginsenosidimutans TaxID=502333 RepID=A0A934U180_9BURK|nr:hypothetical protein [Ramlibacter ginsenosidimutans]MBK6009142.1 hypothetical protein [Ramlibacter ginsenosidimutans]